MQALNLFEQQISLRMVYIHFIVESLDLLMTIGDCYKTRVFEMTE